MWRRLCAVFSWRGMLTRLQILSFSRSGGERGLPSSWCAIIHHPSPPDRASLSPGFGWRKVILSCLQDCPPASAHWRKKSKPGCCPHALNPVQCLGNLFPLQQHTAWTHTGIDQPLSLSCLNSQARRRHAQHRLQLAGGDLALGNKPIGVQPMADFPDTWTNVDAGGVRKPHNSDNNNNHWQDWNPSDFFIHVDCSGTGFLSRVSYVRPCLDTHTSLLSMPLTLVPLHLPLLSHSLSSFLSSSPTSSLSFPLNPTPLPLSRPPSLPLSLSPFFSPSFSLLLSSRQIVGPSWVLGTDDSTRAPAVGRRGILVREGGIAAKSRLQELSEEYGTGGDHFEGLGMSGGGGGGGGSSPSSRGRPGGGGGGAGVGGGMGGLGSAPSANSLFPSFKCELPLSWTRMPAKSKSLPRGLVVIPNPDFPWKSFVTHSEIWPLKLNGDQYFEALLVYKR